MNSDTSPCEIKDTTTTSSNKLCHSSSYFNLSNYKAELVRAEANRMLLICATSA